MSAAVKGWVADDRSTEEIVREMAEQAGVSVDRFLAKLVNAYGDRAGRDLLKRPSV